MGTENWYQVDNVSKVFLATYTDRDTRSLRVGCTLKEPIDKEILQKALETTIKSRPIFQVRIRKGVFWHYMEPTKAMPKVSKESGRPCPSLYGESHKGKLHYRVTYYENRINLDMFHVLADGTGALGFLNILVLEYLKIKYPDKTKGISVSGGGSLGELEEDSYRQFYNQSEKWLKKAEEDKKQKPAYQLRGAKLPYNQLQFFHVTMPKDALIKKAKETGVGVSAYLGAMLMMAIYQDMPALKRKMPVTISMPVNLRNFYPSETSRNFFNSISISHVFTGEETLQELAKEYDAKMKQSLEPEQIRNNMDSFQKIERLMLVRMVPLVLKQFVVGSVAKKENKKVSAVISNLGVMKVPEEIKPYVEGYSAFCSHNEPFITVCGYGEKMTLGITYSYRNTGMLKKFIRQLTGFDIPVTVEATKVVRS